jgi:hypothetical protein
MSGFYSRAAMREARREREAGNPGTPRLVTLADVPADAPYDDAEAVLHVWVDDNFVPYAKWLASSPISVESVAAENTPIPADATCVAGVCGGTRVWLVRDGDRWLMFAGSRNASGRRRDFASPFLGHAIRTAEFWYGAPVNGWRAEGKRNGSGNAGDSSAQEARAEAANG